MFKYIQEYKKLNHEDQLYVLTTLGLVSAACLGATIALFYSIFIIFPHW